MKKILLLSALFIVTSFWQPVKAQTVSDLSISPPKQEVNLKPGGNTRIQIKFFNRGSEALSGYIKTADFVVNDKDGTPSLLNPSITNNKYSASKWLTLSEDRVTIANNSPYTLTAFINVPQDAYPCGHYTSVYFEPATGDLNNKKSATSISYKLVSLIYINVDGKCPEKAFVSKIQVPTFMEYGPIPVQIEILNQSGYHIAPQGVVGLTDFLNSQADLQKIEPNNIFPETIRSYTVDVGSKWMFGRYRINLNAGYGKTGQILTGYAYVWVFPWKIILIVLLTLLLITLLLNNLYKRIVVKESILESEIKKEKQEIEELKRQLKKRHD